MTHRRPTPIPFRRAIALAFAIALLVVWARADGTITLRPHARLLPGQPILLSDIASLTGDAESLADAEIAPAAGRARRLTLDDVRGALNARPGINWGRLALSGSVCRVETLDAPAPASPAPTSDAAHPAPTGPTVRAAVIAQVLASLNLPADKVRFTFDDRPATLELLDASALGRTVAVRPIGSADRLPISVTVYEGQWIAARGIVRAEVEVLREVAVLRTDVPRGTPLTDDLLSRESHWLPLTETPLTPASCVGAIARTRLEAGATVSPQDVQAPIAIRKGDHAVIHCLSGGVVLKLRARALQDGRVGELIEFAGLDGKKGRVIHARVDAPGVAVAAADLASIPGHQPIASTTTTDSRGETP